MSGIHNWRVSLAWPTSLQFKDDNLPVIEYQYENDAGETTSNFQLEEALAALLLAEVVLGAGT